MLYVPIWDKRKERKADKLNVVYVMQNRQNGYYKIGRSISPTNRERTLQAQEPDVVLLHKWFASAEIEKMLHEKFKGNRLRGEWFKLSQDDIDNIKSIMEIICEGQLAKG